MFKSVSAGTAAVAAGAMLFFASSIPASAAYCTHRPACNSPTSPGPIRSPASRQASCATAVPASIMAGRSRSRGRSGARRRSIATRTASSAMAARFRSARNSASRAATHLQVRGGRAAAYLGLPRPAITCAAPASAWRNAASKFTPRGFHA